MRTPKRQLLLLLNAGMLFFFLLRAVPASAQQATREIDSLWKVVGSLKGSDRSTLLTRKQKLSDMFGLALYGDVSVALRITDSLAETCRLLGDSSAYFEALYRNKASIYQSTSDYIKTFDYLRSYANALARIGKKDGYAYVDVGNQYFGAGLLDLAREYYKRAGQIFHDEKNYAGSCTVLDNLALICRQRRQTDSCVYYYLRSAQIRRDSLHDPYLEAYSYVCIGGALFSSRRNDEAYDYLSRGRTILDRREFEQYKDFVTLRDTRINCYRYLALYFIRKKNADSAQFYTDKAVQQINLYAMERERSTVLYVQARLALLQKKYPEALAFIREAEAISLRRKDPSELLTVYELYTRYYTETGEWKLLSEYQDKRYRLNDSLSLVLNDDQMLIMNNALLQYDNDVKIARQKSELSRKEAQVAESERNNRLLLVAMIALGIIVLLVIFFMLQFRKKNRLIEKYNADLEAANKTKEKFLSVISHDLRSPFNTLIGLSNLLVASAKRQDYSHVASGAEAISEASRKAYVLLDNLMQWVSLQKENIHVKKEPVPIVSLVDEILLLFRNQALTQDVTIVKDIQMVSVFTDPNMLQVMLRNLLSNAIRHIPAGGKVSIRVVADGNDVVLAISDNGNGIDPELLRTIFHSKNGMNVAMKGSGLGLGLVREFVDQLGGTVAAENLPEGGARFTIRLFGAVAGISSAENSQQELRLPQLSAKDREQVSGLLNELRRYEIFDSTELRKLLDENAGEDSDAIAEWRSRLKQAVYHSDEQLFEKLLKLAETGE